MTFRTGSRQFQSRPKASFGVFVPERCEPRMKPIRDVPLSPQSFQASGLKGLRVSLTTCE